MQQSKRHPLLKKFVDEAYYLSSVIDEVVGVARSLPSYSRFY